eukprot:TRINITY_DN1515_c0_g1_i1.p1 TRINITY_DN1515_c0_g1~~TRINITY_DN1515_c0_g1_i1.p1  ORF type:complete len:193 (+),score=65.66 TRINITY_DN1515_c0_g1_i1:39-617(+)
MGFVVRGVTLALVAACIHTSMGAREAKHFAPPVVMGEEALMAKKGHGTCTRGVQDGLLFNVDAKKADEICCFNRHYAEHSGYAFTPKVTWMKDVPQDDTAREYFDSIHGKRAFTAPKGRSFNAFVQESMAHGWPSFRDSEVNWDVVRVLPDGECVTVDGVHLGHNIPDRSGNRYCINLVCIAAPGEQCTANL